MSAYARNSNLLPPGLQHARTTARAEWERACEELLDRYFDNGAYQQSLISRLRLLYPNNADEMIKNRLSLNVLRRIVDTRARLYRKPPQRRLIGESDPADAALFAAIYRRSRADVRMKWLNRFYELLNCAVLWGQIGPDGYPHLSVLPAHHLMLRQSQSDPLSIEACEEIYVPLSCAPSSIEARQSSWLRYDRDAEGRVRVVTVDYALRPHEVQPEGLEAYSSLTRFPFVLARKGQPLDSEIFPDASHSLINAARWIDHELTRGALNSRHADFPAYTFNGTQEELGTVNPATGAGAVICLGSDDKTLEAVSAEPRERERNENLLFFLKMLAQTCDISPSAFTYAPELLSGVAKFHDKQPEIEYREEQVSEWKALEELELWPMLLELSLAGGVKGAEKLSGREAAVDFPQQMIALSRKEELENLSAEIALGLRSPVDEIMRGAGVERGEALALYQSNISERDARAAAPTDAGC